MLLMQMRVTSTKETCSQRLLKSFQKEEIFLSRVPCPCAIWTALGYLAKSSFHDEALLDAVHDLIGDARG